MKFIFFENPANPDKVAYTVSNKPVSELKDEGIIPSKAATLVMDYVEPKEMDMEMFLMLYNLDSVQFDNKSKPKRLVVNSDVAIVEHLQFVRDLRIKSLATLDGLQIRAMVAGKQDVVGDIEKDKQRLRDVPVTMKLGKVTSLVKLHNQIPVELLVDYEEKYKGVV